MRIRYLVYLGWRRFWFAVKCPAMAQIHLGDPWWATLQDLTWALRIRDMQEGEPWKTGWWCWPWRHTITVIAGSPPGTWRHRLVLYQVLELLRRGQPLTGPTQAGLMRVAAHYAEVRDQLTREGA